MSAASSDCLAGGRLRSNRPTREESSDTSLVCLVCTNICTCFPMHVSKHIAADSGRQVNIACKIFAVFALSAQPQPRCSRDVQLQVLAHCCFQAALRLTLNCLSTYLLCGSQMRYGEARCNIWPPRRAPTFRILHVCSRLCELSISVLQARNLCSRLFKTLAGRGSPLRVSAVASS